MPSPPYLETVDTTIDTPRQQVAAGFEIAPGARVAAEVDDSVAPTRDDDSRVDLAAVQALADMARSKQAVVSWFALERAYYRGVEAAAEQVLHPEVASVQSAVGWIATISRSCPGTSRRSLCWSQRGLGGPIRPVWPDRQMGETLHVTFGCQLGLVRVSARSPHHIGESAADHQADQAGRSRKGWWRHRGTRGSLGN